MRKSRRSTLSLPGLKAGVSRGGLDDDHGIYVAPEPFRPHWLAWGVAAVLMVLVVWVLMVVIRG